MDVSKLRHDFPLLAAADPPVYLDNACMSLKPRVVIDRLVRYYEETPVCAGRSVYDLSRSVADDVAAAREEVARWLGAASPDSIVFTRNATEALNLVAWAFRFRPGDVVLGSDKEHNSNLVPWQVAASRVGLRHEVLPSRNEAFDLPAYEARLARGGVRLVAMAHASNLDGSSIPAREVVRAAHEAGARVLLDGAQAAPHAPVDVASLGVDFYAVSLHKALGPTGMGALYVAPGADADLGPFLTGGDTVVGTTYAGHELAQAPSRYEAGLQDYAGILGSGEAVRYLRRIGMDAVEAHERRLNEVMTRGLADVPGLRILGPADPALRGGIVSFTLAGVDPHELAILLNDKHRILVRSGDHCVHSWFHAHAVEGSVRASTYVYNTETEARAFGAAVADLAAKLATLRR